MLDVLNVVTLGGLNKKDMFVVLDVKGILEVINLNEKEMGN